jgi:hypothetical protein
MEDSPLTRQDRSDLVAEAQLEKLRLEIQGLQSKNNWDDRVARYIPLLSVLITVAGFSFGVYQFRVQQKYNADRYANEQSDKIRALEAEFKKDKEAKERDFTKPLWEKQLALYFEASAAAATISRTKDPEIRKKAEETFWELYQGPLAVIETKEVSAAMISFKNCMLATKTCGEKELGKASLELASTIQHSLSKQWNVMVGDLPKDKIDYNQRLQN